MNAQASNLWNGWRNSTEIHDLAVAWIAKPLNDWTEEDERLTRLFRDSPDEGLATIFAIMQLTDDTKILGSLGAGRFEDFLGLHGEKYLDVIHAIALEQKELRTVLDSVWQGAMPKHVWHQIEILKQSAFS